jgi:hypothetical protein
MQQEQQSIAHVLLGLWVLPRSIKRALDKVHISISVDCSVDSV